MLTLVRFSSLLDCYPCQKPIGHGRGSSDAQ
uniref:Uncharacterized protein n=1 Tax=Siphoviridae sp. ctDhw1 TaxID=2827813 RepID=A0A8S5SIF4_9CAUD|nr:MAG TPA: hypothetical protein [Siphoviridae sp. ctDhw1]DAO99968.1 MAG TPA: hypothetical protein [Caudoviricetes sp.]